MTPFNLVVRYACLGLFINSCKISVTGFARFVEVYAQNYIKKYLLRKHVEKYINIKMKLTIDYKTATRYWYEQKCYRLRPTPGGGGRWCLLKLSRYKREKQIWRLKFYILHI